jgi:hypothetical protein
MKKSNFRDWTLTKINKTFGLRETFQNDYLTNWLSFAYELNDFEKRYLKQLQATFNLGGDDWNEAELENKFISPLIVFAQIDNIQFSYFLERELTAQINDYELLGKVDGMIATGYREPEMPYFCMNEYKKESDPNGDPKGQALIAMLVAQHLHANTQPVFGLYVVGRQWRFMVLEGKQYIISKGFLMDDDEIFDIYRLLKGLKQLIFDLIQ